MHFASYVLVAQAETVVPDSHSSLPVLVLVHALLMEGKLLGRFPDIFH